MVILSVVSAKGGVGKTTLTANLAMGLSRRRPTLVVDLDPQNALRLHLGISVSESDGLGPATLAERAWSSAVRHSATSGVQVLPFGALGEPDRDALEVHLSRHPDWLSVQLGRMGVPARGVVLIDTPPGPSLYQQQALRAADMGLVVVHADAASYATIPGMESVLNTYCHGRHGFAGSAYVLNDVPPGSALSRDVVRVVRAGLGDRVAPVIVHQDESVREALAFDQPVLQYAPHGEATRDINQLVAWVDEWIDRAQPSAGMRVS